ncbi:MAG TPA: TolC family protein [Thermoclostridium sp.]
MRKKVTALVAIINALFALIVPQARAASGESILNRQKAIQLIKNNSTAIWDAKEQEQFAKENYEEQAARSKSIDTVKVFLMKHPLTGEELYYYYDSAEQMQLRLLKEYVPETLKFSHEIKEMTIKVTENTMANVADNLFTGLYSTYHSVKLAEKSVEAARKNLTRQKELFENGMITELELQDAELDLKEAENSVKKAKRDYDNMHRQFNALAKLPLDFRYDFIATPWLNEQDVPITEEEAVASALENRMEIWSVKRQIELMELKMEIYRHRNVYQFDYQTIKDYAEAQNELDKLKTDLGRIEYDIENEIRKAYKELKKSYNDLELAKLNLAKQKNQLETIKIQYDAGLIPVSAVEQMELAIAQLEFAVNINLLNVLNKQDQFYRAISVGPGYTQ